MADLMILESLSFICSLPPSTVAASPGFQSADGLSFIFFMNSSQTQLHVITVNSSLSLKLKRLDYL